MFGKDITERKLVEERLRQSEDKFRTIFDSITEVLFVHDCETGKILDVNHRACEVFGYSRDELIQLNVEAISSGRAPYNQANALDKMRMAMGRGILNGLNGKQRREMANYSGLRYQCVWPASETRTGFLFQAATLQTESRQRMLLCEKKHSQTQ